jgi:hypothetical protein
VQSSLVVLPGKLALDDWNVAVEVYSTSKPDFSASNDYQWLTNRDYIRLLYEPLSAEMSPWSVRLHAETEDCTQSSASISIYLFVNQIVAAQLEVQIQPSSAVATWRIPYDDSATALQKVHQAAYTSVFSLPMPPPTSEQDLRFQHFLLFHPRVREALIDPSLLALSILTDVCATPEGTVLLLDAANASRIALTFDSSGKLKPVLVPQVPFPAPSFHFSINSWLSIFVPTPDFAASTRINWDEQERVRSLGEHIKSLGYYEKSPFSPSTYDQDQIKPFFGDTFQLIDLDLEWYAARGFELIRKRWSCA